MYPVMGLPPVSLPVSGCHDNSTALAVTLATIIIKALGAVMCRQQVNSETQLYAR